MRVVSQAGSGFCLTPEQPPDHPGETPVRLARGVGDGDWRRLDPAPPTGMLEG